MPVNRGYAADVETPDEQSEDYEEDEPAEKKAWLIRKCPCLYGFVLTTEEAAELSSTLEKRYICLSTMAFMGTVFVFLGVYHILSQPFTMNPSFGLFMIGFGVMIVVLFLFTWRVFIEDVRSHAIYLMAMRNKSLATLSTLAATSNRRVFDIRRMQELDRGSYSTEFEDLDAKRHSIPYHIETVYNGYEAAGVPQDKDSDLTTPVPPHLQIGPWKSAPMQDCQQQMQVQPTTYQ